MAGTSPTASGGTAPRRASWRQRLLVALSAVSGACGEPGEVLPEPASGPPERFALPLDERERFTGVVGVDHDPEDHGDSVLGRAICTAYDGAPFPACYDGHDGTDFLLDGGFEGMDAGSPAVLAAADGVVVSTEDGHTDRCHVEGTSISCGGAPIIANHVVVEHPSGVRTLYWHLAEGSVAVRVGDEVRCGDRLGRVGSSGYSAAPHLHFGVLDVDGAVVDPFAGPMSQPESWWTRQDAGDGLPGGACREAAPR